MMTRDVLLDLELDEDDDEDGDIGEQGAPRGRRRGTPRPRPKARAHAEEVGDRAWALRPPRGGLWGPSAARRSAGGRAPGAGSRKPAPPSRGPQCGRLGPPTGVACRLRCWRSTAPGTARGARGTQGPREQTLDGKGRSPGTVTGGRGTPLRAEVLTQKQLLGHFLRLEPALGFLQSRRGRPACRWGGGSGFGLGGLGCDRLTPLWVQANAGLWGAGLGPAERPGN